MLKIRKQNNKKISDRFLNLEIRLERFKKLDIRVYDDLIKYIEYLKNNDYKAIELTEISLFHQFKDKKLRNDIFELIVDLKIHYSIFDNNQS